MRLNAENLLPTKVGYVPGSFYIEATDETFWTGTPRTWIVAGNLPHHDGIYYLGQYRRRAARLNPNAVITYSLFQEGRYGQ